MTQGVGSRVGAWEGAKEKGSPTPLSQAARSLTARLKLSEIQVVSCLGCMRQVRSGERGQKEYRLKGARSLTYRPSLRLGGIQQTLTRCHQVGLPPKLHMKDSMLHWEISLSLSAKVLSLAERWTNLPKSKAQERFVATTKSYQEPNNSWQSPSNQPQQLYYR